MDFGPFSFMDIFDPDFTPNHDDFTKRYSFANQPGVIWWNLLQFAQDIAILLGAGTEHLEKVVTLKQEDINALENQYEEKFVKRVNKVIKLASSEYKFRFTTKYAQLMSERLGIDLKLLPERLDDETDLEQLSEKIREFCSVIVEPLLQILQSTKVDYNHFFVNLQDYQGNFFDSSSNSIDGLDELYISLFFKDEQLKKLIEYYQVENKKYQSQSDGEIRQVLSLFNDLKEWTKIYKEFIPIDYETRRTISSKVNPLFIPRSWIFNEVIDDLTQRQADKLNDTDADLDLSLLNKMYLMSTHPYDPTKWDQTLRPELEDRWANLKHTTSKQDEERYMKQLTCSS